MVDKITTSTAQVVQKVSDAVTATAPVSNGFVTFHIFGLQFTIYPMMAVLVLAAASAFYFLWKAQKNKNNDFDAFDMLMDEVPVKPSDIKTKRTASIIKMSFSVAFGVATWVVIDKELRGQLGIDIYGPYLTLCLGSIMAKLLWDKPFDPATLLAMFGKKKDE
jgi:hypothetical protein